MAVDLDQIRAAADRVASSHGLEVVAIEYIAAAKQRALRVYVEKNAVERASLAAEAAKAIAAEESAGEEGIVPASVLEGRLSMDQLAWVTHTDCESFSTDFGTLIDVEELVPGAEYTLEVSSPGLDRKLYGAADFERFKGSLAKVQTFEPIAGNRHWQGRLASVEGIRIVLDLAAAKGKSKAAAGKSKATAGKSKKKTADQTVEIEIGNIESAHLVPEI